MDKCLSTSSTSTQTSHCEKASSFKKRCLKAAKEQRSRLYILKSTSTIDYSKTLFCYASLSRTWTKPLQLLRFISSAMTSIM
ncbi:hypothetical protein CR513_62777, partial [Mucuna pruriens]